MSPPQFIETELDQFGWSTLLFQIVSVVSMKKTLLDKDIIQLQSILALKNFWGVAILNLPHLKWLSSV